MWIKAGVSGGTRFSNLEVWIMAVLGITIAFLSSRKWVDYCHRKLLFSKQEVKDNGIDRKLNDSKQEGKDNEIDRLPDDILCSIVSRLKAIEASRTSILCRRWRKIWTMNPLLQFNCLCTIDISKEYHDHVAYGDRQRFLRAVNQCLQLYYGSKLKSFFMRCCFLNYHINHLVCWMQALARLDTEELYLDHSCQTCPLDIVFTFSFKFIHGLSKLWKLDLTGCYLETSFVSQCDSLTSLALWDLPLRSEQLCDILLSCPNLRSLEMNRCKLPQNLRITGPNLKLETLKLICCLYLKKLEILDFNVVDIKVDIHSEVEIWLSSVPKLAKLHLNTRGMNCCFWDAPRNLPQLTYLIVEAMYQIVRFPPKFQVFGSIRILYIITNGYHPYGEAFEEVDLWNFAQVLGACPLLQDFYLMVMPLDQLLLHVGSLWIMNKMLVIKRCSKVSGPFCEEARRNEVQGWPVLRHKHLEYMELSSFSNTQNEFEFAKFILANAQVLHSLVLGLSSPIVYAKQKDLQLLRSNLQAHALSLLAKVDFKLSRKIRP